MTPEPPSSGQNPELLIAEVAEDFLRRIEQGENPSAEEYVARYPALGETLREVLPVLTMVGSSCDVWNQACEIGNTGVSPERVLGDFKIIREVGRGGMGVVYEAQEISLGRRVALKVLPFAAVLDSQQLKRFKIEAQVAAQLHHTHIVPVYSVGHERGVHYYAMQYVEGHTLSTVIQELREFARGSEPSGRLPVDLVSSATTFWSKDLLTSGSTQTPEYVQSVARLGIQAAEALQHAHDLAIIHRDIKPSNLILDARGHLWITDFGLAQCRSHNAHTLTLPGDIMGTLCYMSPEQALGQLGRLDHRTDIYSLAVTLYEMLALKPAFTGRNRQQLLARIEYEEPPRLARLNPAVSSDLDTVLHKAMAKDPGDRYDTARALVEDLQRLLEHRPIQATRPSLVERLSKWSRRHRTLVNAMLVVLLVMVVASLLSTVLIWREMTRTEAALTQVETERQRAQAHYEKAREAVDEITRIVEMELASPSTVPKTRRDLLLKAEGFYRSLLETNSQDPLVIMESVRSYQRIGEIHLRLGQNDQAETAYRSAMETCKQVSELDTADSQALLLLVDCTAALANVLQELGQVTEGLKAQAQVVEITERINRMWPGDPDHLARVALEYTRWGRLLVRAGQREQGIEVWIQAMEYQKAMVEQYPKNCTYQVNLASDEADFANMMWGCGQQIQAIAHARQAVVLFERLAEAFPDRLNDQFAQVRARMSFAGMLWKTNRRQEADEQVAAAKAFQERLMTLPAKDEWHEWLMSWNLRSMGLYHKNCGRMDEAIAYYQQSDLLSEQSIVRQPYNAELRRSLASNYCYMGCMQTQQGRFQEAEQALSRGKALCEQLIDEIPDRFEHRAILARIHIRLANVRLRQGRPEEAVALVKQAKQLQDDILRDAPDTSRWSWRFGSGWSNWTLARQYGLMAEVLAPCGYFKETTEVLQAAAQLDPPFAESYQKYQALAETAAKIKQRVGGFMSRWLKQPTPPEK